MFLQLCNDTFFPRKDKYSSKRDKYYVDFKDLESKKRTNTETEEHTETSEANLPLPNMCS